MCVKPKTLGRLLGLLSLSLAPGLALAELKYNFPEPVSPLTQQIFDLHMMTAHIAFWIMVVVLLLAAYIIIRFRKSKGFEPDQEFHKGWFGRWWWVLAPVVVFGIDLSIMGQGSKTLAAVEDYVEPDMTIKVIGSQWKWTYEYMDEEVNGKHVRFTSNKLSAEEAARQHEPYLRSVDKPLVLPTHKRIRILNTATDVIHDWWVPQVAPKKDAIPGYINETWTNIQKEGTYRGQCAENCGRGHAFMPIVVKAVSEGAFRTWIEGQKQQIAAADKAAKSKMSKETLLTKGETVYKTNCAACHQASGMGVPNVFPALNGSAVVNGPVAGHLKVVLNGRKGKFGQMPAWRDILNDVDVAAAITYERNAWDNKTGDVVQPTDVAAAR